jgi:signal transduction histidine kinase
MTAPHEFDPASLASRIAEVFSTRHGMGYAQLAPNFTLLGASDNLGELLDVDPDQVTGSPLTDIFWEFVGAETALSDVLHQKRPDYQLDMVNRSLQDGTIRYYNYLVLPLDEQNTAMGLLLLVEDVTPRGDLEQNLTQDRNELRLAQEELYAANQELQRLDRLKSIFLAVAAHDLRTPLTAIYGNASLLRDDLGPEVPAEHQASLATIISQAEWLNRLISNILDLDQIEQGQIGLHRRDFDLRDLVEETGEILRETVQLYGHQLQPELPDQGIMINADPDRVRQVLFNLLSNAIKYTPSGGKIGVSVGRDGSQAFFRVQDNGPGMSPEELNQLYELYYRTPLAKKSGRSGTGLGLFIVKTLVDAHQGKIEVASRPGQGTTFTVWLPADDPEPQLPGG